MIEREFAIYVEPWARRHSRLLRNWGHDDHTSSLLLLRAPDEPFHVEPSSLAILMGDDLVGRFTFRQFAPYSVFTGIVVNPYMRNLGLGVPSLRASLYYLEARGFAYAYASIAASNSASLSIHYEVGFLLERSDWRAVPPGVPFGHLVVLGPEIFNVNPPQLRYRRLFKNMSE